MTSGVPTRRESPTGPAETPPSRHESSRSSRLARLLDRERTLGTVLMAPGVIVLVVTTTLPLLYLVGVSLFQYDLTDPTGNGFVGLGNYIALLGDSNFWHSLRLSGIYTVTTVTAQVVLGLALALAFERTTRGRGLLRVAALLPTLVAPVVVGLVWRTLMLTPDYGIVDFAVDSIGLGSHAWLGDPTLAFLSVVVMHTWQWTPFAFLVFLASLVTIPQEVLEAARIDRANAWQRFWHIVLPYLRPAIVIVVIFRTVIALSAFAAIFAATGGGPGVATEILNLYIYRVTFRELSIGYGSALAVVLLLLAVGITLVFARLRRAQ